MSDLSKALEAGQAAVSPVEGVQLLVTEIKAFRDFLTQPARQVYDKRHKFLAIRIPNGPEVRTRSAWKTVEVPKDYDAPPTSYVRTLARTFELLVEKGLLVHGMLLPCSYLPLQPSPELLLAGRKRFVVGFLAYAEATLAELNAPLGGRLFVNDGEIGDGEWDHLAALRMGRD